MNTDSSNRLKDVRDLIAYRDRYSYIRGEGILDEVGGEMQRQGYATYEQLIKISDWKAGRRIRRHIIRNSPQKVMKVTKYALSFEGDESRVSALRSPNLHGVGVPVASAILTFYNPVEYGIIDQHTSRSLYRNRKVLREKFGPSRFFERKKLVGFTVEDYLEYLRIIRKMAETISKETGIVFKARDVNKALWQEDRENGGPLRLDP